MRVLYIEISVVFAEQAAISGMGVLASQSSTDYRRAKDLTAALTRMQNQQLTGAYTAW